MRTYKLVAPLTIFAISQILIWLCLALGDYTFPMAERMLVGRPDVSPGLELAVRWDAAYYLDIAGQGYRLQESGRSSVAFFPLYPLLVSCLAKTGLPLALAGVLLNGLCSLGGFIFLYRLTLQEFGDQETAVRAVGFIALFPTAFFFATIYSEGLFLLLSVGGFYAARNRQWGWACLCGVLATATRPTGMILWGGIALEWLLYRGWSLRTCLRRESWRALWTALRQHSAEALSIALIPLGLVSYMNYLKIHFSDPWAFASVQSSWGRALTNPLTEVYEAVRYCFRQPFLDAPFDLAVPANTLCFIAAIVGTVVVWRELGESYGAFCLVSILVPTSVGFMSFSRFVLLIFPLYMVLARHSSSKRMQWMILGTFSICLAVFTTHFVNWFFIA